MRYGTFIISGILFLLTSGIAVFTVIYASAQPKTQAAAFDFAYLYVGLLAVCSFGSAVAGLAEAKVAKPFALPGRTTCGFFLICLGYILALTYVGHYLLVTAAALTLAQYLLGVPRRTLLAVAVVFPTLTYLIFSAFLNVPLP